MGLKGDAMGKKDYPDRVPPVKDIVPPGLRKCPLKFRKKRRDWVDQYCDKDRCGWWNDEKARCGYIQ